MRNAILMLMLLSAAFAYSIESYESHVRVLPNGDLNVFENITFVLEQAYNEGYRSIRPADAPGTSYVLIDQVKVNGEIASSRTQVYDGFVEIDWSPTHEGVNVVELNYTLKDRVEIFDDYARVCYEHFGANWDATAKSFSSSMRPPDSAAGKDMHFEIYSSKKGEARVEGLDIVTEIDNVPPGNYVGGCYLFDKDSVVSSRIVNGSALQILADERRSYGSEAVLEPGQGWQLICFPILIITFLLSIFLFLKTRRKRLPETILPPGKEDPVVVNAIVNNSRKEKDLLSATLLGMINRGFIDIIELEKKGETSTEAKRERTILIKKKEKGLEPKERAVMDMLFHKTDEVDLDAMAKELGGINDQEKARAHHVPKALEKFKSAIDDILSKSGLYDDATSKSGRRGAIVGIGFFAAIFLFMCAGIDLIDSFIYNMDMANFDMVLIILGLVLSFFLFGGLSAYFYLLPGPPKGYEEQYMKWEAFARGLKSGRIKEYPPSSVAIWGDIIVYAAALGLADKVKKHLSELDQITMSRVQSMEKVAASSYVVFASARGVGNLKQYGNRQGYSSRSSGGWSSGGGGGFSGGSSGGGGFR